MCVSPSKDINAAGGPLGKDVTVEEGDSSDAQNPTVGTQTIDRELGADVDAIVGAASSAVTLNVIDKVTSAGVVMFSPANTSKKLSTYPDKGLYFRDAPSDILQGQVLGEVVSEDNVSTVGLARPQRCVRHRSRRRLHDVVRRIRAARS